MRFLGGLRGRLKAGVVLGAALVSLTLIGGSAAALHSAWQSAHAAAGISLERAAQVIESSLNRQLLQVDSALASLPGLLASVQSANGAISAEAASRLLRGFNFQSLVFRDLLLVDDRANIWAAARPRPGGGLSTFEPASAGSAARLIGPVRNALTGEWSLYLTRPVVLPDRGRLLAAAEIPVALVTTLLAEAEGGSNLHIRLERPSGELLASLPHNELAIGKQGPGTALAQRNGKVWEGADPSSGALAFRVARATLYSDIVASISEDADIAMAGWRHDRNQLIAVVALAELLVLGLAAALLIALRKREELEADRSRARQQLENAIEAMSDGFAMWDKDDRLITFNQKFRELYTLSAPLLAPGMTYEEMIRRGMERGQYPHVDPSDEKWLEHIVAWHARAEGSMERQLPDGRWVLVKDRHTDSGEIVGIRTDITALKQALSELEAAKAEAEARNVELVEQERRIRFLAHHDALTQLPNRVLFRARLEELLARPKEAGAAVALLYLDLDKFKEVNDTLGHPVGDRLLVMAAERLREKLRDVDLIARLGGDEFAVASVLSDPEPQAAGIGERIVEALTAPFLLENRSIAIGVSVGIKIAEDPASDPDNLLRKADMALYEAKLAGRGRWRFFEPAVEKRVLARVEMQRDLEAALGTDQFLLHYQPVFDLETGAVCSFEALLRWNHPERGLISPGVFIPIAEETGLIREIGSFVLRQACSDATALPAHIRVAVNLSAVQLASDDIYDLVVDTVAEAGLAPHRLELEVTESALVEDSSKAARLLHRLHDFGIRIVLDDFGTGYSALSYLRLFPFQKIKIDQSFVREMATRPDSAAIVGSIVGLAEQLGLSTTAEGVETAEQLDFVRKAGCKEAQGFLFGRPKGILHAFRELGNKVDTPEETAKASRLP